LLFKDEDEMGSSRRKVVVSVLAAGQEGKGYLNVILPEI
jgi:hypothetical protein